MTVALISGIGQVDWTKCASGVFDHDALDHVANVLATIDRGFEILVKIFQEDHGVHIGPSTKKISHGLAIDFVALSFEFMQFQQARIELLRPIEGRDEQIELRDICWITPADIRMNGVYS